MVGWYAPTKFALFRHQGLLTHRRSRRWSSPWRRCCRRCRCFQRCLRCRCSPLRPWRRCDQTLASWCAARRSTPPGPAAPPVLTSAPPHCTLLADAHDAHDDDGARIRTSPWARPLCSRLASLPSLRALSPLFFAPPLPCAAGRQHEPNDDANDDDDDDGRAMTALAPPSSHASPPTVILYVRRHPHAARTSVRYTVVACQPCVGRCLTGCTRASSIHVSVN